MDFSHRALRPARAVQAVVAFSLLMSVAAPTRVQAQRGGRNGGGFGSQFSDAFGCQTPPINNVPYDGRFILVRLIYPGGPGECYYRPRTAPINVPSWAHGYAFTEKGTSEANLLNITSAISSLRPRRDGSNAIEIEDPELFKYPVAFMTEAQYAQLTDKQAETMRRYLLRGGFLIVDDTRDESYYRRGTDGWPEVAAMLHQILPDLHPIDLSINHPIFHAFFDITDMQSIPQYYDRGPAAYRGIFVDNDPTKRLMVMIGFNNDLSNYWEFSPMGLKPVDESNTAYKLGVNYLFYALTH